MTYLRGVALGTNQGVSIFAAAQILTPETNPRRVGHLHARLRWAPWRTKFGYLVSYISREHLRRTTLYRQPSSRRKNSCRLIP